MNGWTNGFAYTIEIFWTQSSLSDRPVLVQLIRYDNPYNLKYRPNSSQMGPFCCCSFFMQCFSSLNDVSLNKCTGFCTPLFTICINDPTNSEKICLEGTSMSSLSSGSFTNECNSWSFGGVQNGQLLEFNLPESFSNVSLKHHFFHKGTRWATVDMLRVLFRINHIHVI